MAVLLLVLALVAGCLGPDGAPSDGAGDDSRGALGPLQGADDPQDAGASARSASPTDAERREQVQQLLDARARAVRDGDEAAFREQLGGGERWRQQQLRWFRSVVQLPWQRFDYEVLDEDWPGTTSGGDDARFVPRVVQRTRLRGFDDRVVSRTVGFVVAAGAGAGPRLVSDRLDGRRLLEGAPAPWDLVPVQARQEGGVLGVFDATTVDSAPEVMDAVRRGTDEVADVLPWAWSQRVVVYVLADREVLDSFTDVPGGSVDLLGALTFPTYAETAAAGAAKGPVASTRMLLLPGSVAAGQPFLGRIVRHELTHVATGTRDDGAPTWFSEGLAEYLGARSIPAAQRRIPTSALARARGQVGAMPSSEGFNGPDQDWHYALSWMAVDHLATTQGEGVLWRLVDAFGSERTPDVDARTDRVLREVTGLGSRRLARLGAQRITSLYG